ncbi:GxxExxY protein [Flavobacterium aquaticum]|uniref:GxxExxY protein n=1 Tax=Flavobacterium aquaticum TaxID=1236486 RepID=A0A327YX72_9FLAO|nr:GxxExxY protein [Flavobacterium aquaticum]RAK24285.1 GxxExxY protein [Flavobacterium aquaticum]
MNDLIYKNEVYEIVGLCMEVHNTLGKGHNEKVYGDALEFEFKLNKIDYIREQKYTIEYKGIQLPSYYYSDFTIYNNIILEIKAIQTLTSSETKQVLNYLAASKCNLGLLVNFGEDSLKYKRIIL